MRSRNWGYTARITADHDCKFGAEQEPTLHWRTRTADGRTYHVDYCFPRDLWRYTLRSVEVGSFVDRVETRLSDNTPVIVDVDAN